MAQLSQGVQLFDQEKFQEAFRFFEKEKNEFGLEGVYYAALSAAKIGQIDKAILRLERILNQEVHFFRLLQSKILISVLYCQKRKYDEAETVLKDILEQGLNSSQVLAALGYVHWSKGNIKESIHVLNQSIQADPKNPTPVNSLGYILADQGLLLDKALELCKKAVSLNKGNPNYIDSLAWVYYKKKELKLAHHYAKLAFDLAPKEKIIQSHLKSIEKEILRLQQQKGDRVK